MNIHEAIEENKREKMRFFSLANQGLTELPESIGDLVHLETLWLHGNSLTELPESIGNLVKLRELDLKDNKITELPESIGNLVKLETLWLHRNSLNELPESIGNLVKLKSIFINNNKLQYLPQSFGKLRLENISIGNNQLIKLTKLNGENLTYLNAASNQLKCLPSNITSYENLETLLLSDNLYDGVSEEILQEWDWDFFKNEDIKEIGFENFKKLGIIKE